jgi:murein L,D-transpeptidase YcbB/YkuD
MIAVVPATVPRSAMASAASPAASAGTAVTTTQATTAGVAAPAYVAPKRLLRYGMRGADVKALQQRLAALKYYPGGADGVFGQWTLEAVWAFQAVQRLPMDGVVGPVTGRALVNPKAYVARHPRGGALRVEINLTARVLVLYQKNKVALISHVSTGRPGMATPTGSYKTTHFYPGWITVPLGQMYDSVFFIGTTYAMHGSNSVPVYPASHGCVRMPMDIATFFHTMVRTPGTPVYVYK